MRMNFSHEKSKGKARPLYPKVAFSIPVKDSSPINDAASEDTALSSANGAAQEVSQEILPNPHFPAQEEAVLRYWDHDDTFQKSIDQRSAGVDSLNEFVFYDGPPFANGLPHYGHLLTGYVKDVVPRYETMKGHRVERVFNWDTHGLPAELEAQKELGFTNKEQIDEVGIAAFNEACRKSIMKYATQWEDYVHRQGRWVDFSQGIKTMDVPYMESVIWAFKQLYDQDLIYRGYRVLPYCPVDQTPLSNHELHMDADVYRMRQDQTVTIGVKLKNNEGEPGPGDDSYALFWTTTPWTVPNNLAIVVGPQIEYQEILPHKGHFAGKRLWIAAARVKDYAKELGENYEILRTLTGSQMAGWSYYPVFEYLIDPPIRDKKQLPGPHAWHIYTADYVDTTEGTGIVHQAPYGEDDMNTLRKNGIGTTDLTDDSVCFTSLVPDYEGLSVFEANKPIIKDLRNGTGPLKNIPGDERAFLFQEKSYEHSYPHCWRCGSPLIYKPVSSWFVKVVALKEQMIRENKDINWIPDNVREGQFGKWLEGSRDWSITRNRYWGTPIPVWISDNPSYPRVDVYGSLAELEKDFGQLPKNDHGEVDLHRPWIDDLVRPNPDDPTGKSTMRRVPDVLDVWFDSGSISFAQKHYPFENKEWFEKHFPADFVVEYIGQTRGWFYVQDVLTTALFDKPPFTNVICHGIVLGSDGEKMSKHLHNYPDVNEVFDTYGSDAMRWFLMSSPVLRGGNLIVTDKGVRDVVRQVLLPLWSSYYFFVLYTNAASQGAGFEARLLTAEEVKNLPVMDQYIIAKLHCALVAIQKGLDTFNIADACNEAQNFIDVLTNWYIRTNRNRFWEEDPAAFNTLYTVLEVFSKVIAPLLPFEAEIIWRGLTGGESVHLTDWPFLYSTEAMRKARTNAMLDAELENAESQENERNKREKNISSHCACATSSTTLCEQSSAAEAGSPTPLGRVIIDNPQLLSVMELVRDIVSTALSLRKNKQIRVRQPLSELTVVTAHPEELNDYVPLLESELNVKAVRLLTLEEAHKEGLEIHETLTVNARAAGPRLGKKVQEVIKASKNHQWTLNDSAVPTVTISDGLVITLEPGEYTLDRSINVAHVNNQDDMISSPLAANSFILLNVALTPQLMNEGWARDTIRLIQDMRKEKGLNIADRIQLTLFIPANDEEKLTAASEFKDLIAQETLAISMNITPSQTATDISFDIEKK